MRPADSSKVRIGEIDTLRGLAAILVVFFHGVQVYPVVSMEHPLVEWFRQIPVQLEVGRLGITVFFIISGFVILSSFESPKVTAGSFLTRRFFRLFPVYWVSLALGLGVQAYFNREFFTSAEIVTNVFMIPSLFQLREVIGVYWTLENEIIFYALCLGLFALGRIRDSKWIFWVGVGLGLSGVIWHWARVYGGVVPPDAYKKLPSFLAIMFWGAMYRMVWKEGAGVPWRSANFSRLLALGLVVFGGLTLPIYKRPSEVFAYLGSAVLFVLWMQVLRPRGRLGLWLGEISYSIYLFHALIMWSLNGFNWMSFGDMGLLYYMASLFAGTLALSTVVYYSVEKPSISLSKKLLFKKGGHADELSSGLEDAVEKGSG